MVPSALVTAVMRISFVPSLAGMPSMVTISPTLMLSWLQPRRRSAEGAEVSQV